MAEYRFQCGFGSRISGPRCSVASWREKINSAVAKIRALNCLSRESRTQPPRNRFGYPGWKHLIHPRIKLWRSTQPGPSGQHCWKLSDKTLHPLIRWYPTFVPKWWLYSVPKFQPLTIIASPMMQNRIMTKKHEEFCNYWTVYRCSVEPNTALLTFRDVQIGILFSRRRRSPIALLPPYQTGKFSPMMKNRSFNSINGENCFGLGSVVFGTLWTLSSLSPLRHIKLSLFLPI